MKLNSALLLFILLLILVPLVPLGAAGLAKLEVASPKDKTKTWSTRVAIDGTALGANEVDINGTKADLEKGGGFSAVALLKPGKNVIMVSATYEGEEKLTNKIRVLRNVTCDDIEKLYKGKQHWAKQQILTLLTLGVIEGYPDNLFLPGNPLSRGEFATWLARAKQLKRSGPSEDIFYDVPKEHWRASYIKAVVDAGYMTGISKDRFGINKMISRGDVVAAVIKANNIAPSRSSKSPFSDVPLNSKNASYIYSAYNKGWIIGVPGKKRKFEPERNMNRGEIAVLLSRLESIQKLKASLYDFEQGYTASQYAKISTKPVISTVEAEPWKLAADGKTPLKLVADVTDAQGKSDISQVWADVTSLGGPNNAKMNLMENGLYGLSFIMTTETEAGEKAITIKALDKSGLRNESTIKIIVTKEKQ